MSILSAAARMRAALVIFAVGMICLIVATPRIAPDARAAALRL